MKIKAFTLSEVMITIGVLGVLAAMLIPTLTKHTPSQRKMLFKKAYSSLEKAVGELANDEANYPSSEMGTIGSVSVQKAFNNTSTSGTIVPSSNDKFCYLLSDLMNTVGTINCPTSGSMTFKTTDGIIWNLYYGGTHFPLSLTDYSTRVVVDVNGDAQPNCGDTAGGHITTACTGNDISDQYEIGIRFDGKIKVISTDAETILLDPTNNSVR